MSKNPQDTLGLAPLKRYNKVRSVRLEVLAWLRIIHKDSGSVQMSTILTYHTSELQDYVSIDVYSPKLLAPTMERYTLPTPKIATLLSIILPTFSGDHHRYTNICHISPHFLRVVASFSKHDYTDWSILHCRLDHIHDDKLANMCKNQLLQGLPKIFPSSCRHHCRDCWICPQGSLYNDPHGTILNIDHIWLDRLSIIDLTNKLLIL